MCLNVVLPNLSLAFSTVTVYQLCRVLLTPMTAVINYVFYQQTIPRVAALVLIPVCAGVGITSYYDVQPAASDKVQTTSSIGIFFALSGVCASAAYTVLIGAYHKKLQMSSSQLLFNQAPIASVMLVFAVPVMDRIPVLADVPMSRWLMILMSGGFASLINISQFFIVQSSGPVTSTVVGHLKTISIVSIGWAVSGRGVTDRSALGVLMTVGGIVGYVVSLRLLNSAIRTNNSQIFVHYATEPKEVRPNQRRRCSAKRAISDFLLSCAFGYFSYLF